MIGGDRSDDSYDHEGGDPAEGTPPPAPAPQGRPESQESIMPGRPAVVPLAQSTASAENAEAVERAARARPLPPALTALTAPLARPEPTGDERVDVALARFEELTAAPVADHVEVFEDVQRRLQDVLASIDHEQPPEEASEEPPGAAAPRPRPGLGSWGA